MVRKLIPIPASLALTLLAVLSGCNSDVTSPSAEGESRTTLDSPEPAATPTRPDDTSDSNAKGEEEHGHKPGAHGGIIVPIGRDSYHAEAVFEKGGALRLFTLGQDEGRVQEVESQTLTAYVKPEGGADSVSISLEPVPQPGDADGKTSQFVGRLPEELSGQAVEVTIPSLRIAGERFRLGFASVVAHGEEAMPEKVADEEERVLYLSPGGKYTDADIEANGKVTASQKFQGLKASHDLNPKPGDTICPITLTKANPKFTWTVGGEEYEFCCPPCVDEFVKLAKESPDEIKAPGDYVKR